MPDTLLAKPAVPPRLTIIGAGHLGRTLGHLWQRHGVMQIGQILNQRPGSAEQARQFIGAGEVITQPAALTSADLFLIATPDDQIAASCAQLADSGVLQQRQAVVVFHCSGALTSEVLLPARLAGASVASIHPIRSFADPAQVVEHFNGTRCGVEGDPIALSRLAPLFAAIGAQCLPILAHKKALYHAAAVFACNYLVTLQDIALAAYVEAGLSPEDAMQTLQPLVQATVDNVFRLGPAAALSGPIARGDHATVSRQSLAVQAWNPDYGALYAQFTGLTQALADRRHPTKPQEDTPR